MPPDHYFLKTLGGSVSSIGAYNPSPSYSAHSPYFLPPQSLHRSHTLDHQLFITAPCSPKVLSDPLPPIPGPPPQPPRSSIVSKPPHQIGTSPLHIAPSIPTKQSRPSPTRAPEACTWPPTLSPNSSQTLVFLPPTTYRSSSFLTCLPPPHVCASAPRSFPLLSPAPRPTPVVP